MSHLPFLCVLQPVRSVAASIKLSCRGNVTSGYIHLSAGVSDVLESRAKNVELASDQNIIQARKQRGAAIASLAAWLVAGRLNGSPSRWHFWAGPAVEIGTDMVRALSHQW